MFWRRRPSLIESIAAAHQSMIRTALGGPVAPPEPPKPARIWWFSRAPKLPERCPVSPVWPDANGGWVTFQCTLDKGHPGVIHRDENYVTMYHNDDITFFKRQYDLLFGSSDDVYGDSITD